MKIAKNSKNLLLMVALVSFQAVNAQWMLINENGGQPSASAALEMQSTDRGILIPRMTDAEKNAIANPEQGLLLYQTDQDSGFYVFKGLTWQPLRGSTTNNRVFAPDPTQPIPIAHRGDTLYVHPTANSLSIQFLSAGSIGTNDRADGELNTNDLVNLHGANAAAATLCDNLTAFGFSDWYLPSVSEMLAVASKSYLFADGMGVDDFNGVRVWTSSISGSNPYVVTIFPIDDQTTSFNLLNRCWCVRK